MEIAFVQVVALALRAHGLAARGHPPRAWCFQSEGASRKLAELRASSTTWFFALMFAVAADAREPAADADRWLTTDLVFPEQFTNVAPWTNYFATLRAEVIAGTLQVKCEAGAGLADPRLVASADAPGHWPARDWRSRPMHLRGALWVAEWPVDSLDVPQIYFVVARGREKLVASPMRLAEPRALGLEHPTRLFWAFVEGFEQELESWRVTDPAPAPPHPSAPRARRPSGCDATHAFRRQSRRHCRVRHNPRSTGSITPHTAPPGPRCVRTTEPSS